MADQPPRCRSAVSLITMATRCILPPGHGVEELPSLPWFHQGKGLPKYPDQRIDWMPGDRREFVSDREDEAAWET
jgi:hypothetical protein